MLGTKIMWAYFRDFVRLARRRGLQDARPCEVPAAVLPNLRRFVWMRRDDTTRQAVSLWKALQTQQWRKDSDEDVGGRGLRFSYAAVDHLKLRIDEHNAAWQGFFQGCGVEPLEVRYEDLVEDYEDTVLWLLEGIGIPVPEKASLSRRPRCGGRPTISPRSGSVCTMRPLWSGRHQKG